MSGTTPLTYNFGVTSNDGAEGCGHRAHRCNTCERVICEAMIAIHGSNGCEKLPPPYVREAPSVEAPSVEAAQMLTRHSYIRRGVCPDCKDRDALEWRARCGPCVERRALRRGRR